MYVLALPGGGVHAMQALCIVLLGPLGHLTFSGGFDVTSDIVAGSVLALLLGFASYMWRKHIISYVICCVLSFLWGLLGLGILVIFDGF